MAGWTRSRLTELREQRQDLGCQAEHKQQLAVLSHRRQHGTLQQRVLAERKQLIGGGEQPDDEGAQCAMLSRGLQQIQHTATRLALHKPQRPSAGAGAGG